MHKQNKQLLKLEVIGIIIKSFKNVASIKNLHHIYSILALYISKKKQKRVCQDCNRQERKPKVSISQERPDQFLKPLKCIKQSLTCSKTHHFKNC